MKNAPESQVVVAAFDVDGTLIRRDCVVPFLVRVAGVRRVVLVSLCHPLLLACTAIGLGDRDRLKELFVGRLLRGRSREHLDEQGRRFASEFGARWLRPDMLARLQWHRDNGHQVVLVSASLRSYLEPLACDVLGGVNAVLCTDVEVGDDGTCTGRLQGANCRGREKSRRLTNWLDGRTATIWAYGNSRGDHELLAMADHAFRVKGIVLSAEPESERVA